VTRSAIAPLAVLAACAAAYVGGNRLLFSDGGGYVVRAEMRDASGLAKESAVKVGGVPAGRVIGIALTKGDTALVTMRLDTGASPLKDGTSARVRPVNLLGEKYVELGRGTGRALGSGGRIPIQRTSKAVELDDVFNMLDADTRMRLAVLLNESGVAMNHRGADFNAMLNALPPALGDARRLVAGLGRDNRRLGELITQSDRVMASMNGRHTDLQRLVVNAEATLRSTARKRAQLGSTLTTAPRAFAQLRTTLSQLESAAGALRPASAALRGTAPQLASTLGDLPAFTRDAVPALQAVSETSPLLRRLSLGVRPTVARLRPAAAELDAFAAQLAPVVKALDTGGVMQDALRVMWGWARTIQGTDGLGHIFGLRVNVDDTVYSSLLQRLTLPSGKTRRHPKLPPATLAKLPGVPAPAVKVPDVKAPTVKVPGVKLPDLPPVPVAAPNVDQTRQDVDRALRYLVGG
jgi:phospholipid/cholesterol/gamma-HCH transport system substrate-binding protein